MNEMPGISIMVPENPGVFPMGDTPVVPGVCVSMVGVSNGVGPSGIVEGLNPGVDISTILELNPGRPAGISMRPTDAIIDIMLMVTGAAITAAMAALI